MILPRWCLVFFAIGVVMAFGLPDTARGQFYGKTIVTPAEMGERLRASAEDLDTTLEEMTGQAFTVATEPGGAAIVLGLAENDAVPADMRQNLSDLGTEAFVIRSDGGERLWIVANHGLGLSHGIYYYLEQLGCRWYLPNERWTLIPERNDIALEIDRLVKPAFIARDFFGTGGFGPRNPLDPKLEMRDRWDTWQRRNRFGRQAVAPGHAGDGFSIRYADQLKAHPEYRAMVDGERVPYKPGVKFCAANEEAVELFVQDRLNALARRVERFPDRPGMWTVSAGPSDSGGHCECAQCLAIGSGSISDRVFHVANVVARAAAEKFPKAHVGIYAYDGYAAVPTIDLEPNLRVWIIPYAFQRTGLTGDELLAAWGEKVDWLGLYTYWNITDWDRNLPVFDYLETPRERLPYWHAQDVQALHFESTYSGGAMGLAWSVASRLMWDLETDPVPLIDEFFERSLADAAPPMRRMMERWREDFLLTGQSLALAYRDLEEAYQLTSGNSVVRARVEDFIRYVEYLRRVHEFRTAPRDSEQRQDAARALLRVIWRIYPSAMVQSYRLSRLIHARGDLPDEMDAYLNAIHRSRRPKGQPEDPSWSTIHPPTSKELAAWLASGVADYPPMDLEPRSYDGPLVPIDKTLRPTGEFIHNAFSSMYSATFHFQPLIAMPALPLKLNIRDWKPNQYIELTVFNAADEQIFNRKLSVAEHAGKWLTLRIPLDGTGSYRLEIQDQANGYQLRFPEGVPMSFHPFIPLHWVRAYFYVPEGLEKLALYNEPRNVPVSLYTADGQEIVLEPEDGPLVIAEVPEGQDGGVWSLRRPGAAPGDVRLLNAPEMFSLSPEALMVPREALESWRE